MGAEASGAPLHPIRRFFSSTPTGRPGKVPTALYPLSATLPTSSLAGLAAGFHDEAARFLAAMSPQEGVREALALHGLTPSAEMALSIR